MTNVARASNEAVFREASREVESSKKRYLTAGTPKLVVLNQAHICTPQHTGNTEQCLETLLVVIAGGEDAVGF